MKRIALGILALLALLSGGYSLRAQEQPVRPKVGLVLAGGGAKGAAHIGVLKVLEENDIPIDMVVGTSMGSIIGGLYAIGYTASEIDSLISTQDWDVIMSDKSARESVQFEDKLYNSLYVLKVPFAIDPYALREKKGAALLDSLIGPVPVKEAPSRSLLNNIPMALVDGQNIYNLFTSLAVGYLDSLDFNKMPIPFACVAVDLVKHEEVVWRSGSFVDALRSSMSIPGYFAPLRKDGRVLVDGGALNNYPVDIARQMGADVVIGVKFGSSEGITDTEVNNIGDMVGSLYDMYTHKKDSAAIENTDIFIHPDTQGYNTLSFDHESIRTLVQNGYDAAMLKIADIRKLRDYLDRCAQDRAENLVGPDFRGRKYEKALHLDRDSVSLGTVAIHGLSPEAEEFLFRHCPIKSGARIAGAEITAAIRKFYDTGFFKSVTYTLKGHEQPYDMDIFFKAELNSVFGIGFRVDAEEVSAIQMNVSINRNTLSGSSLSLTGRLSVNPQASILYTYAFPSHVKLNVEYAFRYSGLNLLNNYSDYNLAYTGHRLRTNFASQNYRDIYMEGGLECAFFGYRSFDDKGLPVFASYDLSRKRQVFAGLYANARNDTRNDEYFPTRGWAADGSFHQYLGSRNANSFASFDLHATGALSFGSRVTLIPSLWHRSLLGKQVPMIYMNVMGGSLRGRYMDQQIPFAGFSFAHPFYKRLSVASLEGRYNLSGPNYLTLSPVFAFSGDTVGASFANGPTWGLQLGYLRATSVGPLEFSVRWSNYTGTPQVYAALGYSF